MPFNDFNLLNEMLSITKDFEGNDYGIFYKEFKLKDIDFVYGVI